MYIREILWKWFPFSSLHDNKLCWSLFSYVFTHNYPIILSFKLQTVSRSVWSTSVIAAPYPLSPLTLQNYCKNPKNLDTRKNVAIIIILTMWFHHMARIKRIWYLSPMRAAKVQASLRIRAVSPEPPLLAHTSSESRGTFRQKTRSLAPLNGWACAVKTFHDGRHKFAWRGPYNNAYKTCKQIGV